MTAGLQCIHIESTHSFKLNNTAMQTAYKSESKEVEKYSKNVLDPHIEPLSLDEAYLDVSEKTSNPYD